MLHYLAVYGLFLAKTLTIVLGILAIVAGIVAIATRGKARSKDQLQIHKINDKYKEIAILLRHEILSKEQFKKFMKCEKTTEKAEKAAAKAAEKAAKKSTKAESHALVPAIKKRLFVIKFTGDIKASELAALREEITAILTVATTNDEVLVILESPGGMVANYGLAASQLSRIRDRNIRLVAVVDKVAASGGYLMACVADRILAAPFAIVGSIGVVAQLPNFHRLLKKNNIDFEQITAGQYKRTLSMFGENTDQGRKKVKEDVEEIQYLFKDFIKHNRPQVDVDLVATGETWPARRAVELNLVDELITSDDYLLQAVHQADVYEICYITKKKFIEKLSSMMHLEWLY